MFDLPVYSKEKLDISHSQGLKELIKTLLMYHDTTSPAVWQRVRFYPKVYTGNLCMYLVFSAEMGRRWT